jgi:hypothetical protein
MSELQRKKRRAHQMKYAIWLVPVTLILLVPLVIAEGVSWPLVAAIVLIVYCGIASYLSGARWERRWEDLIRKKAALGDPEDHPH